MPFRGITKANTLASIVYFCLSVQAALAQSANSNAGGNGNGNAFGHGNGSPFLSTPEIDASSGALAVSAIVAMFALAYALRRRTVPHHNDNPSAK